MSSAAKPTSKVARRRLRALARARARPQVRYARTQHAHCMMHCSASRVVMLLASRGAACWMVANAWRGRGRGCAGAGARARARVRGRGCAGAGARARVCAGACARVHHVTSCNALLDVQRFLLDGCRDSASLLGYVALIEPTNSMRTTAKLTRQPLAPTLTKASRCFGT